SGKMINGADAEQLFRSLMSGEASEAEIGALLMALRIHGETPEIIIAATKVLRSMMTPISAPDGAMDIVGTGGDSLGTYNISTASALVTAACGVPVAKHGNKAFSSRSGVADILEEAGLNLQADFNQIAQSLRNNNFGFLLAPRHHGAMRHVGPARIALGIRTIFNILGPLCNPANVKHYLIGCYTREWLRPMAETLGALGAEHAWVVHGHSGMDEISTTGETQVACWHNGSLREFVITPDEVGIKTVTLDALIGGTPAQNLQALHGLLRGEVSAYRDIVLLNTAAALCVAGKVESLTDGVALAAQAIDSGAAQEVLNGSIASCQAS
ncbi:MAG: anthranilate phosphoribosyltransferase, partial [Pseudomonadota bacterium]